MSVGPVSVGAVIFLVIFFLVVPALDILMLVSLLRPGDERNQVIVWKASAWTLLAVACGTILQVVENTVTGRYEGINPFIHLAVISTLYFVALLYYKRKHGG